MNFIQRFTQAWREAGGRSSVQNATVSTGDSSQSLLDFFSVTRPASGFVVNEKTAMTVATVYRCVAVIGGAISQLPIHQFERAGENKRRVPADELWSLLNREPHEDWTAASWKEWIVQNVLLRGDSFAEIVRPSINSTKILRITPLKRENVVVGYRDNGELAYQVTDKEGNSRIVGAYDMLHFAGLGFNGRISMSVLDYAARNGVGNSLAAADYAGRTFAEGVMPHIAFRYPNKFTKEQGQALRDSYEATYNTPGTRKIPLILGEGGDVKQLSMTPEDAQLIETRKYEKGDICTAFGVPPIMIGDSEKTTSWGTGIEQITIGFVRYTLKPHLVRWEEELNRKLFGSPKRFVEFEVDGLLRGDSKAQADYFTAALGGPGAGPGWMTVNEVRKLRNLEPVANGDELYYPKDGNEQQVSSAA